jgi:DNA-binding response OmpR family regulator
MFRIALIHWKIDEIADQIERLSQSGYEVDTTLPNGPPYVRRLAEDPPVAVIVDLTRRPSHGRDIAMSIRMRKTTRRIPVIFIGGGGCESRSHSANFA